MGPDLEPKPAPAPSQRLRGLSPYRRKPGLGHVDLRLDGNEGVAPDPAMLDALRSPASIETLRAYPSAAAVEDLLAERFGVGGERVLVTAGADEALDRVFRAFADPGQNVVLPEPTFEMLPRYAALAGCEVRSVEWPSGAFPVAEVADRVDADTALVFVVTPNNPTGAVATRDDLVAVADAAPDALIVLDHAYAEFADDDLTEAAVALPNCVVVRTLSKAWGLAGLRVGYVLGGAATIDALRTAGSPYAVAGPSLALARAALVLGDARVRASVERVRTERTELARRLRAHGLDVPDSQGNFVLARGSRAAWLAEALGSLGIAVRSFAGRPLLDDAVRVTCPGDARSFERLCAGTDAALAPEAILFDLDGVLADVSRSYREAIVRTAAGFGVEVTADDVRTAKARGDANNDWVVTHRLVTAHGVDATLAEVTVRFEELYQGSEARPGLCAAERPLVDADTWRRWAERQRLAIVTGRPRADAERFLRENGLFDACAALVCMEDGPPKPDPSCVRRALEQLGVTRAWFIGDTRDDIEAARAAGVVPIGVVAPGERPDAASAHLLAVGAARVLASTTELEELR